MPASTKSTPRLLEQRVQRDGRARRARAQIDDDLARAQRGGSSRTTGSTTVLSGSESSTTSTPRPRPRATAPRRARARRRASRRDRSRGSRTRRRDPPRDPPAHVAEPDHADACTHRTIIQRSRLSGPLHRGGTTSRSMVYRKNTALLAASNQGCSVTSPAKRMLMVATLLGLLAALVAACSSSALASQSDVRRRPATRPAATRLWRRLRTRDA